jgi:hypothetical protein
MQGRSFLVFVEEQSPEHVADFLVGVLSGLRQEGEFGSETVQGQRPTRTVATAALKSFSGQSIFVATFRTLNAPEGHDVAVDREAGAGAGDAYRLAGHPSGRG